MKNIHILPTDQPSRFSLHTTGLYNLACELHKNSPNFSNHHIYITSDEEIKEGYWYLDTFKNEIRKAQLNLSNDKYKKIILTTDPTLIADGVQAIDDEFLEWFVKNSSCEFVHLGFTSLNGIREYKIIIPQEEPKQEFLLFDKERANTITSEGQKTVRELQNTIQQETLEEAAEKRIPTGTHIWELTETRRCDFIAGAKWQSERMYSEEDMEKAFQNGLNRSFDSDFDRWIEQFKKK